MNFSPSSTLAWAETQTLKILLCTSKWRISPTAMYTASALGDGFSSSPWRTRPFSSSASRSCCSVELISTRPEYFLIFLLFMVSLLIMICWLWFWLTQPTIFCSVHVHHLKFRHSNLLLYGLRENKDFQEIFFFFFFFSFFLLSLFAPLNGIQQLEDTSDTQLDQVLSTCLFCALRAQFLCDTALPLWRFWLGTLALTTGSLRPIIGGNIFPATSIHPILNPFILLA